MLLTLLVIVCVLGLLLVAATVAVSDRELLVDVAADGPGTTLPAGRVGAEDVDALRFGMAFRGYRMDEVDRSLARLAQELAERDARIAQLEAAIADAVGAAVDRAESQLGVDHARQAEEAQRAEAEAELAAAREEVGPPSPDADRVEAPQVEQPERPGSPASGLAAVAAWGPITSTSVSAPWVESGAAAAAAEHDQQAEQDQPLEQGTADRETAEPEAAPGEPVDRAEAPLVAAAPHAPPWPASEPTHPEPLVPDSVLEPGPEPGPEPGAEPGPAAGPDAGPASGAEAAAPTAEQGDAAGLFDFPEVVPPPQAAPELPEATDDDRRDRSTAYARDDDEERGIT